MEIAILGSSGHLDLKWDPQNEEETKKAKEEFERLEKCGYAFFVQGGPKEESERVKTWDALTGALEAVHVEKKESKPKRRSQSAAVGVPPTRGGC